MQKVFTCRSYFLIKRLRGCFSPKPFNLLHVLQLHHTSYMSTLPAWSDVLSNKLYFCTTASQHLK